MRATERTQGIEKKCKEDVPLKGRKMKKFYRNYSFGTDSYFNNLGRKHKKKTIISTEGWRKEQQGKKGCRAKE